MPDPTAVPERGPAAGFGDDPVKAFHAVGCIADAATIRERADGTFEVLATGTTRVRLLSVDASGPVPDGRAGGAAGGARATRPGRWRRGCCGPSASTRSAWRGPGNAPCPAARTCPDEPSVVSYLVAAAMMLDTPTKQRLLQAPDTASRLRDELKLLRAETAIIRNLPSLPASDLTRGPTSLN